MSNPRKQVYFSEKSIDKELLEFINKQTKLSKALTLGMQILFEIYGNIDIDEYLPVAFEAHESPVTYEKLLKKLEKSKKTSQAPSNELNEKAFVDEVHPSPVSSPISQEQNIQQLLLNPQVLAALMAVQEQSSNVSVSPIPVNNAVETPEIESHHALSNVSENKEVVSVIKTENKIPEQSDPNSQTVDNNDDDTGSWNGIEDYENS